MNVFKTIRVNYVVNYCQFFNKNTLRYACYKNIKKSGCIFIFQLIRMQHAALVSKKNKSYSYLLFYSSIISCLISPSRAKMCLLCSGVNVTLPVP